MRWNYDLMTHFDAIITDVRLSSARCSAYLEEAERKQDWGLLLSEYRVSMSGGSTGTRPLAPEQWPRPATHAFLDRANCQAFAK
jgi:hypothetical protein